LKPIKTSGQQPLKEASKKAQPRKDVSKNAPHDILSRCRMRAYSTSFFGPLFISHWGVFKAWAASYLSQMTLSLNGEDPLHSRLATC